MKAKYRSMKVNDSWFIRDKRKFRKAQQLLTPCITERGGVWADFGCGEGIFTAVLYEEIGPSSQIYAIDKNQRALTNLKQNFHETYPEAKIHILHANFIEPLSLPALDGFIMANALHFLTNNQKKCVLGDLSSRLKDNGKIIIIEYNTNRGNFAVPFPFNEDQFILFANRLNLRKPQIAARAPSSFLGEMYAGTAFAP
jgi:ubiquinone/menaquinone biosynthesis C-methylase UbiE